MKATMPTPSAYLYTTPSGTRVVDLKCVDLNTPGVIRQDLITTTQAEAYADARVREQLEKVQRILTSMYTEALKARVPEDEDEEGYNSGCLERALALTDATLQIRALIPK